MKTNVCTVLCVLALAVTFGCQPAVQPTAKPEVDKPNKTGHDHAGHDHSGAGYVEPLVPKTDAVKPEEKPEPAPPVEPAGPTQPAVPAPKTSAVPSTVSGKFAADAVLLPPVADLTAQIDEYVTKIGKNIEELDGSTKYKEDAEQIVRDANGLILVTKAAGLAADDSKYKKFAPQIIAAAKKLETAENLEAAQKTFAALKEALEGKGEAGMQPLDWNTKTASLKPVMKAVPNLNSAIKRTSDKESKLKKTLEKKSAQLFGGLAALAAIAQGSIANVQDTAKPDAHAEWKKECEQLRDTALKANAAAHAFADGKADYAAFAKAMEDVNNSCHDCHKIFSPENAEKTE
ncbi:MAG: hypothetical protein LBT46_10230 [Planctomycetaceae bacterium]|jgi:hypothetical protein|nr:hypothetical protein [Planctomycetaceae bacterium]